MSEAVVPAKMEDEVPDLEAQEEEEEAEDDVEEQQEADEVSVTGLDDLRVEPEVNPFVYPGSWTPWEVVKALVGIVVVPIRIFVAGSALLLMGLFAKLATLGSPDENKPMSCWRNVLLWVMRPLARLFMFAFGFYWIDVKGKRARRAAAPIFVIAPHSTFVDTFMFTSVVGLWSGLGKKEVRKTPVFGTLAKAGQIIPVDRENPEGRKAALNEFVRRAQSDEAWRQFVVFPEGTCTNRRSLIQFKVGAFVPGVPVQPVLLRWPFQHFDPTWTSSSPSRMGLIMRLLTQVYNRGSVEFLPVYVPSEEEKADAGLYASNVRQLMAEKLGVPTTEHSYADTFLSMAARKAKFKPDAVADFEFEKVSALVDVDLKEAKRLLRRFGADARVRKTGKMNAKQFAKALDVPLTDAVQELFDLLDSEGFGSIDYKRFLVGLTFLSKKASSSDAVDVLFTSLDPDGSGEISAESLRSVLSGVFSKVDRSVVARLMRAADPDETGRVDRASFEAYVNKNPEMLLVGLRVKESFDTKGRPLSVRK